MTRDGSGARQPGPDPSGAAGSRAGSIGPPRTGWAADGAGTSGACRPTAGRRARDLRDHRRPGDPHDPPLPLPARAARAADVPRGRGGVRRLDRRPAAGPRARGDRRRGRDARRGGLRPARRAPVVRPGRLRRRGDLPAGGRGPGRSARAGLLPGDPALAVRHRRRRAGRRRPHRRGARRRREALRPRPRVGPRARRGASGASGRVADLPHRPLPREDGVRGDPLPAARQRDAGAGVEPELHRLRPDHHGRDRRRRGPGSLLRPRRRACATWWSTT